MSFCMHCAASMHETANACPQCGGLQRVVASPSIGTGTIAGELWMPITSLITGILGASTTLQDSGWDRDEVVGVVLFFVLPSVILGALSLNMKKNGKGMAIAGLILGIATATYVVFESTQLI